MNTPPPMPSLLDLLMPPPAPPVKVTKVRVYICACCGTKPRKVLASGRLDGYCADCRYHKNIEFRNKLRKV